MSLSRAKHVKQNMESKNKSLLILIALFMGMIEVANAFYDPGLQRWLNRDPIGEAGDLNVYTSNLNDPIGLTDAFGLFGDGQRCFDSRPHPRIRTKPTSDEYYPLLRRPEFRGHSDFTGGDEFDFTKEDQGLSSPFIRPGPHFQDLDASRDQVQEAIDLGDKDRFERAMHRLQDFFTHRDKRYLWDPWHGHFGHLFDGTAPDNDEDAWERAERESREWVDRWHENNGITPPSGPCN